MNSYFHLLLIYIRCVATFITTPDPKRLYQYHELKDETNIFQGNNADTGFFKLLHKDVHSILIGSRNVVYNISILNLTENIHQRIEWPPTSAHRELCLEKGKSEQDCHNYIRVWAKIGEEHGLIICGTNAFKPLCRNYTFKNEKFEVQQESNGLGRCPYDPNYNSTTLITDGKLYSATAADFEGRTDPIIYREPIRTERADPKQLNEANFISSISLGEYVFFFFREVAVEYINCGKAVYSRVARVCKKDTGGPDPFSDRWTSFLKARLNCSVPGEYPFYFDEIQSTSQIVVGVYNSTPIKMIYGVFNTPPNGIGGSAICAFKIDSILRTFKKGYKEQATLNANWLRVPTEKIPQPRPGECVENSGKLPHTVVNFIHTHSLMDEAVPSFKPPLLVRISPKSRFVAIIVDPQVRTLDSIPMDVLFIGTEDGKVVKATNKGENGSIFSEELQVNARHAAIKTLSIARFSSPADWIPFTPPKLIIVTNDDVQTIPLYRCTKIPTCKECVGIQDPYCAWDTKSNVCVAHNEIVGSKLHLLQNIFEGVHKLCPTHSAVATHIFREHLSILKLFGAFYGTVVLTNKVIYLYIPINKFIIS